MRDIYPPNRSSGGTSYKQELRKEHITFKQEFRRNIYLVNMSSGEPYIFQKLVQKIHISFKQEFRRHIYLQNRSSGET